MYKDTCILFTSQCFLNCWASKGPFGLGKARQGIGQDFSGQDFSGQDFSGQDFSGQDFSDQDFLGQDFSGQDFSGIWCTRYHLSFHHMAVIYFTALISSGVRAQQGQAWRRRCCVVFNQEFQPVLSLVSHLFPPAKKFANHEKWLKGAEFFYQSITCFFNSSGTNFFA